MHIANLLNLLLRIRHTNITKYKYNENKSFQTIYIYTFIKFGGIQIKVIR